MKTELLLETVNRKHLNLISDKSGSSKKAANHQAPSAKHRRHKLKDNMVGQLGDRSRMLQPDEHIQ